MNSFADYLPALLALVVLSDLALLAAQAAMEKSNLAHLLAFIHSRPVPDLAVSPEPALAELLPDIDRVGAGLVVPGRIGILGTGHFSDE